MWWRSLVTFLAGCVLGTGFGVALGFFLFPFVFPPPPAADQLTDADRRNPVVAAGTFIHANPSDPIHWGKGSVTVRATGNCSFQVAAFSSLCLPSCVFKRTS